MLNRLKTIISNFKFVEFHGIPLTVEEGHRQLAEYLIGCGVILPPCTVGQTIYALWNCGKHGKSVAEFEVKHIDIDYLPNIEFAYISKTSNSGTYHFAKLSDFGKTVFLTREEAEEALEGGVKG